MIAEVEPSAYMLFPPDVAFPGDGISVERTHWPHFNAGPFTPPHDWAIRRMGRCLNRNGEWEWEPQPSSREQPFLARCRFDLDEALEAAKGAPSLYGNAPAEVE